MVTITNYKKRNKEDGSSFFVLEIQSGVEFIQSHATGQFYATAKKCYIPSTFDEAVCKSLLNTQMPGSITKVECEPFQYIVKETGELVTMQHRYEYVPVDESMLEFAP